MAEKLTRELVESHLMSFVELKSRVTPRGTTRWAWILSAMAAPERRDLEEDEFEFRYKSQEAARNYALGWIRKNRPDLQKAAVQEAADGIHYRATR